MAEDTSPESLAPCSLTQLPNISAQQLNLETVTTGIAILPPDRLLLTGIYEVICFNMTNTITERLKQPGHPWDIAVLPHNKAALTLPMKGHIKIISTDGVLSPIRTIENKYDCRGISVSGENLVVLYNCQQAHVEVMDIHGSVLQTISPCVDGEPVLDSPLYLLVTREGNQDVMYISDWNTHSVIKTSMSGQVLFTYTDEGMVYPNGLDVTETGHLVVCCQMSKQLQLVTTDGQKVRTLLADLPYPQAVAVCPEQKKIYLSCSRADDLLVYKYD